MGDANFCHCTYLNKAFNHFKNLQSVGDLTFNLSSMAVIPKCFQVKAEVYHSQLFSKNNVTALTDDEGLYDPECQPNGLFKAKQCNSSDVCWCVDSAGVRQSDNGDRNLQCEELVLPKSV